MQRFFCYGLLIFIACTQTAGAQQLLFGRVFKKGGTEILPGVSVHNTGTKKFNTSDMGGNYRISAATGDTIIFSSAGYLADTFYISGATPPGGYNIFLTPNIITLPTVEIDELSKYEADSLQRRSDYAFILEKKHPVKLMNEKRVGDAPGLNFSPIGYFSKKEKEQRKLKKQVIKEDEEEYIDARFSLARVAFLTRLTGDSLQQFMLRYRPSYTFCRNTDYQQMFMYINDKVILFRQGKRKHK